MREFFGWTKVQRPSVLLECLGWGILALLFIVSIGMVIWSGAHGMGM